MADETHASAPDCACAKRKRLEDAKGRSFCLMSDLAEAEAGEFDDVETDSGKMDCMLEKVMRDGTYRDAVHAIRHFVDFVYVENELRYF